MGEVGDTVGVSMAGVWGYSPSWASGASLYVAHIY